MQHQLMKNHLPSRLFPWPKTLAGVATAIVLLLGGRVAWRRTAVLPVPTAEVRRGEFVEYVSVRGNVKALRSIQLSAPSIAGDLQIVKLTPMGTMVKKGDVVVQFDITTLQATLDQKRSELKSADADIDHSRAEARLSKEQQATDLLAARYAVDRAQLDTKKQEILSEIDGAETRLKLSDAQQKYRELQQKDISMKDSTDADIESKQQKRTKSLFDVQLAQQQITSLTLRAPADGMVNIMPNFRARNWTSGGSTPDFKEGDRAWSGAVIAQLPDLNTVRASARVDESDRGRLKPGLPAIVRIDAIADREFPSSVAEISPLAKLDYSSWPFTKNFDIALQIQESDSRIRPGLSASARIAVEKIPDAIVVPSGAVFERDGRSLAYVLHGSSFEKRGVQVGRRGRTEVLITQGLQPGEKVALQDPTQENHAK
jgi:RND family efflux transporter MFP subunit